MLVASLAASDEGVKKGEYKVGIIHSHPWKHMNKKREESTKSFPRWHE